MAPLMKRSVTRRRVSIRRATVPCASVACSSSSRFSGVVAALERMNSILEDNELAWFRRRRNKLKTLGQRAPVRETDRPILAGKAFRFCIDWSSIPVHGLLLVLYGDFDWLQAGYIVPSRFSYNDTFVGTCGEFHTLD